MQYILQHKEFSPSDLIYGFLGKHPDVTTHRYTPRYVDHEQAASNRNKILAMLGTGHSALALVEQCHGADCINIASIEDINYDCKVDAQITMDKNIILAIDTADCVPVLLADPEKGIIAAAHAGWKGAIAGIVTSTLEKMAKLGARNSDIIAIIGPCIRQDSYEVSKDFLDQFLSQNKENAKFFKPNQINKDKYLFDLPGYVTSELTKSQVKEIFDTGLDTLTNPYFFSHRRSCLAGEKREGNNLSFIGLR
jgi:YfiH family protein